MREKDPQASTRKMMKAIAGMPLIYEPGTRFSYSLAHDVLAVVVEVVSGKKFSEYVKEFICDPLGIEELYFHWEKNEEVKERLCALYMVNETEEFVPDDGSQSAPFKMSECYESGGAGLAGTVEAYSTFADALCNNGVGRNGGRILEEKSVKMFMTPYITGKMKEDFARFGRIGYEYGLGVRVMTDNTASRSPIGEFGWDGAAGAYVLIDPIHHVSIFYVQHIMNFGRVYLEIHPHIRDFVYEGLSLT